MGILRKVFRFVAEYFVFFVGLLFIFVIGFLYASIRPEGIINLVFLLIVVGWVIFIIRYFWELMEKHEAPRPGGRSIFSPLLRRGRNPPEAENSSHSSPGLRPRFSAKGDKNSNEPKTALSDLPGSSQKLANNKRS